MLEAMTGQTPRAMNTRRRRCYPAAALAVPGSARSNCGTGSCSSPTSRRSSPTTSMPNDALQAYFVERALGGVGLIVDGHMTVMTEGMMAPHYIRAWEEDFIPAVPAHRGRGPRARARRIIGQVTHAGHTTLTEPPRCCGRRPRCPSRRAATRRVRWTCATSARTIDGFGACGPQHHGRGAPTASRSRSPTTDCCGASPRPSSTSAPTLRRHVREADAAVRSRSWRPSAWPSGRAYPIGIRSASTSTRRSDTTSTTGCAWPRRSRRSGLVDYFNCDAGTFSSFWMEIPPAAVAQGFFRPLNRALKQASRPAGGGLRAHQGSR